MIELTPVLRATAIGLQVGLILALIVTGLTIIFGLMDVINIAHGSLYMLGAYFGFTLVDATGSFWVALVIAPVLVGLMGLLIEVFTIRPLYGRNPLYQILVTLGIAFIIEELVKVLWGTSAHNFSTPGLLAGEVDLIVITYPVYQLFVLVLSAIIVTGIWLGLRRTNFGILMRASAEDSDMVDALGYDVSRLFTVVFVFAAMLAGLAGVLIGPTRAVNPTMWFNVVLIAFAIIVIGGLGSFRGAVVGSLLIGLLTAYTALVVPSYTDMLVFILMGVILLIRPAGLFGTNQGELT